MGSRDLWPSVFELCGVGLELMRDPRPLDRRLVNFPVADPMLMLRVAERLRKAFGVPVVVGLPDYSLEDWRAMPYWFRVGGTPGPSWD
jgi:hypothetical protein